MNPRPLSMRNKVRLMIAITILVWSTQTLLHQWGFGQTIDAAVAAQADAGEEHPEDVAQANAPISTEPAKADLERFVPGSARFAAGASLELRGEASVVGAEVRLRQVCRWTENDETVFAPLADLVLTRLDTKTPYESVTLQQIKSTLHDAGANLAVIRFAGATACTVSRSDIKVNEQDALQKWAAAKQEPSDPSDHSALAAAVNASKGVSPSATSKPAVIEAALKTVDAAKPGVDAEAEGAVVRPLKAILIADLAQRLGLPEDKLEMSFNPKDEKILKLAEPAFKFQLMPKRVRNLGSVSWDVMVVAGENSQTVAINAGARAWQQQVILSKPLAYRQVIQESDLAERRALVDNLMDDKLLEKTQIVGQQAARDMKPGQVMTGHLVESVPLAKQGQFVTITLNRGGIRIKTVARAMEMGSFGQTIRVKNEATKDIYEVVLTGPQEGSLGPALAPDKTATDIASTNNE